jgi:hypothetical protein
MRLALAPKVAVVAVDTAVVEVDKVVVEVDKVVAEVDTAVAEVDEGVADEDQREAVASYHRHKFIFIRKTIANANHGHIWPLVKYDHNITLIHSSSIKLFNEILY